MPEQKPIDQEADFSNYLGEQKPQSIATEPANPIQEFGTRNKANSLSTTRKVVYFIILILLFAVFAYIYINKPNQGQVVAPEGYIINSNGVPPKLEKAR